MSSDQTTPSEVKTSKHFISAMNRFKHGGAAESLFVDGENPDEFFALLENAFEQHKPGYDQDAGLVTDSVRARWILNRRQRASDQYESVLYNRKPDARHFIPDIDVEEILIFDRYITAADRSLLRALQKLNLIKKMARDDERWKFQLEKQKKKFAMDVELFELRKQREEEMAEERDQQHIDQMTDEDLDKMNEEIEELTREQGVDEAGIPFINQQVWAAFDEAGVCLLPTEYIPTNHAVRRLILSSDGKDPKPQKVRRTYHLKGVVPETYYHLLKHEYEKHLEYQEVKQDLTFEEWSQVAATEPQFVPRKTDK